VKNLARVIKMIGPLDKGAMEKARFRQDNLTKPRGSMGRLEELSVRLAGIQGRAVPQIEHKAVIVMAGDHGVASEGIGNWPQEITAQMVRNFLGGGAGINVLARQVGARLVVVDMGVASELEPVPQLLLRKVGFGTGNITKGPAMSLEQAIRAVETGVEIITGEMARGLDIVGTGDMGIANTTSSSAICAVMTGKPVAEVTGRGTGLSDEQLARKVEVIRRALEVNQPDRASPLEVLAKVGGFEIGGLVGVMLGAAASHIPVVIDGFISGAAALIAAALAPGLVDFIIPAHVSTEAGHPILLEYLGLKPLLDLGMRLGEGTGSALGIFLAETAARVLAEMATFGEAGVSEGGSGS